MSVSVQNAFTSVFILDNQLLAQSLTIHVDFAFFHIFDLGSSESSPGSANGLRQLGRASFTLHGSGASAAKETEAPHRIRKEDVP